MNIKFMQAIVCIEIQNYSFKTVSSQLYQVFIDNRFIKYLTLFKKPESSMGYLTLID